MGAEYSGVPLAPLVEPLLRWYTAGARVLPWRANPTPYRVWISEIMLQQTRVEAVKPYFERFVAALPGVVELAAAPEELLLKLWEGLGYYNRVRNLQKAARCIVEQYGGHFPAARDELLALPGIGAYTAGAIASIAFGLPEPAVDGNVLRVVMRVAADASDVADPATREVVAAALKPVYPAGRCSEFTQSLMELGATVCLPNGRPKCEVCPLAAFCRAHQGGVEGKFPVKAPKKPRRVEARTILLLCCEDRVALRRRPSSGLLAGLWEFPGVEGELDETALDALLHTAGISALSAARVGTARHIFTHREWRMTAWRIECPLPADGYRWVTVEELESGISLPSAFKPFRSLLRRRER